MPNYYYKFTLDFVFFDTQQNRNLGVFIVNIQLKNKDLEPLANYHKGVPVFQIFTSQSFISNIIILVLIFFKFIILIFELKV